MLMKTLAVLILFCVSLVYAEDTNITSKVFEKKEQNGEIILRMETTYRGKEKVLMIMSRRNKQGRLAVTSRSYLVCGNLVMTESDEDRDGTFETIAAYSPGTDEIEVFIRQPDGTVKPVSTKTLEAYKKQQAALPEFFNKYQTNMSNEEFDKLFQETQKKIQDAEKEKDDKK